MAWEWIARLAQSLSALGPPGLFAITFLDGTAIPIVGGAEALTLLLAWKQPAQLPWIVLAGALGATLGALVFYRVGRAGGQLVLARMKPARREWLKGHVARHAFWTLLVGVLLPPPFPTKPLVLTAGVVGTPAATFILAIFTGRVLRFSALACIGIQFGGDASTVLTQHYPAVLGALTGLAIVALLGGRCRSNCRGARPTAQRRRRIGCRVSRRQVLPRVPERHGQDLEGIHDAAGDDLAFERRQAGSALTAPSGSHDLSDPYSILH